MNKHLLSIFILFSVKVFGAISIKADLSSPQALGEPLRTITASGVKIPVFEKVSLKGLSKTPVVLKLSGGGIREKQVFIASVNVYLILSYTDLEGPMEPSTPLKSLAQSKNRLLRLTFLRDVDAKKIKQSFSDSLKENGISLEDPPVKEVLESLNFDIKKGNEIALIGSSFTDSVETLKIVFPENVIEAQGKTLVTDFWKIWFGKSSDGGLEDLKPRLLSLDQLMHL